jgi:EAL and modified HD-GYP domain-containing signal transduction protein
VAGEGGDAASIAAAPDAPAGFAALTPDVLSELNLSAAAWFGAHVEETAV